MKTGLITLAFVFCWRGIRVEGRAGRHFGISGLMKSSSCYRDLRVSTLNTTFQIVAVSIEAIWQI